VEIVLRRIMRTDPKKLFLSTNLLSADGVRTLDKDINGCEREIM